MPDLIRLEDDAPARRVVYAGALLLVVIPFVQAVSQLWPLQLGNIQWRYAAANALSSVLLLPFLGLMMLLLLARAFESRRLSTVVGAVSALFALLLAGSLVLFALDALQLKTIVTSQQMAGFQNASIRVGLVTLIFTVTFSLLALAGFRTPKTIAPTPAKRGVKQAQEGAGLIVGREYVKTE
jgi:hypothetical protein